MADVDQAVLGPSYQYVATVLGVVDGDTVDVAIDLGFDIVFNTRLRLLGINAPEIHGVRKEDQGPGLAAKAYLARKLGHHQVIVQTEKDRQEKYGRYLAVIYLDGKNVNEAIVKAGHAVPYDGGKRT